MLILPAIDLRGGKCVRLKQGDYAQETVFGDDPVGMARRWVSEGARALRLGSSSADLPIVKAFRTVAAEFLTRHDETIALAVLDGSESLFVAIEETSQPIRLVTHVGSKTPAFASASGRPYLVHPIDGRPAGTCDSGEWHVRPWSCTVVPLVPRKGPLTGA